MKQTFDVVAIGELLVDFCPAGEGANGYARYEMNPGGAPANCLASVAALGGSAALISAVGQDFFGDFLTNELKRFGVSAQGVARAQAGTTLAFVQLQPDGERAFHFVRGDTADCKLSAAQVDDSLLQRAQIVHFGSVSLSTGAARETTLATAARAKAMGKIVSFDANYRAQLWKSGEEAAEWICKGIALADVVKLSQEEAELITRADYERAAHEIFAQGKRAVLITLGARGTYFVNRQECGLVESFDVQAVDTTGCGDAFMGAILFQICYERGKMMHESVRFANAVGALCATRRGGMAAMPSRQQVLDFMMQAER